MIKVTLSHYLLSGMICFATFSAQAQSTPSAESRSETADCVEASRLFRSGVDLSDSSSDEERFYTRALELCPTMAEAQFNLGVIWSRRGQVDQAMDAYKKALSLAKRPEFYSAVGSLYLAKKDFENARLNFESALSSDPQHVPAMLGLGIVFDSLSEFKKAEEMLLGAAKINQSDAVIQYNLGVVYEHQDRLRDAITAYENAVGIDDQHFSSNFQLGLCYQKAGRYSDSRKVLERASTIQPDNSLVHSALGVTYEKSNQSDRAELAFRRAVKLNPKDGTSLINLGVVLMTKSSPNPLEAQKTLVDALKLEPNNAKALTALGWAEIELGRHDSAEETLRHALELDPNNAYAHNNLGVLYLRTNRDQEAEKSFKRALAINPDLIEARKNVGQFDR